MTPGFFRSRPIEIHAINEKNNQYCVRAKGILWGYWYYEDGGSDGGWGFCDRYCIMGYAEAVETFEALRRHGNPVLIS